MSKIKKCLESYNDIIVCGEECLESSFYKKYELIKKLDEAIKELDEIEKNAKCFEAIQWAIKHKIKFADHGKSAVYESDLKKLKKLWNEEKNNAN